MQNLKANFPEFISRFKYPIWISKSNFQIRSPNRISKFDLQIRSHNWISKPDLQDLTMVPIIFFYVLMKFCKPFWILFQIFQYQCFIPYSYFCWILIDFHGQIMGNDASDEFLAKIAQNDRKIAPTTVKCPWNSYKIQKKFISISRIIAFLKSLLDYALKICVTILITALGSPL